jgi:NADH:ubiquinone oxidoreductase subunit 5 (subunit L)/multisubunit Na+/H+ antiporter MnhA subunit
LGEEKETLQSVKEGSGVMVFSVVVLAVLSIVGGFFIMYPEQVAHSAVLQAIGVAR